MLPGVVGVVVVVFAAGEVVVVFVDLSGVEVVVVVAGVIVVVEDGFMIEPLWWQWWSVK